MLDCQSTEFLHILYMSGNFIENPVSYALKNSKWNTHPSQFGFLYNEGCDILMLF